MDEPSEKRQLSPLVEDEHTDSETISQMLVAGSEGVPAVIVEGSPWLWFAILFGSQWPSL